MALQSKSFIGSLTIWGLVGVAVPYLDQLHTYLSSLPEGTLPPKVSLGIQGLGWVLALVGRVRATQPLKFKD